LSRVLATGSKYSDLNADRPGRLDRAPRHRQTRAGCPTIRTVQQFAARPPRPGFGDVRFHDQRGAACLVDLGGESFQTVQAAGHECDGGPCSASRQAVAAPIPLLAPVTRAVVPVSFDSIEVMSFLWMYGVGQAAVASPQVLLASQRRQAPFTCASIAPSSRPAGVERRGKRACRCLFSVLHRSRFA
jgi:hypothetical protein